MHGLRGSALTGLTFYATGCVSEIRPDAGVSGAPQAVEVSRPSSHGVSRREEMHYWQMYNSVRIKHPDEAVRGSCWMEGRERDKRQDG